MRICSRSAVATLITLAASSIALGCGSRTTDDGTQHSSSANSGNHADAGAAHAPTPNAEEGADDAAATVNPIRQSADSPRPTTPTIRDAGSNSVGDPSSSAPQASPAAPKPNSDPNTSADAATGNVMVPATSSTSPATSSAPVGSAPVSSPSPSTAPTDTPTECGAPSSDTPAKNLAPPVTSGCVGVVYSRPPNAGGDPTATPTPLDCAEATNMASVGACQASMTCSNDSISSTCSKQTDGTWFCYCSSAHLYGAYTLLGADESTACTALLQLCTGGNLLQFSETAVCLPEQTQQDPGECRGSQQCGRTTALSDTITAIDARNLGDYCSDPGDGPITCSCNNLGPGQQTYVVTGATLDNVCHETFVGGCNQSTPPFSAEPECTATSSTEDDVQCLLEEQCVGPANLADGISADVTATRGANCTHNLNGTWQCYCGAPARQFSIELGADVDSDDHCGAALLVCTAAELPAPEGPITCDNSSVIAEDDFCAARVTCTQHANLGGLDVGFEGAMGASCQLIGDVWSCNCTSDTELVKFELQPADVADAHDACIQAAASCPNLIAPRIGMNTAPQLVVTETLGGASTPR